MIAKLVISGNDLENFIRNVFLPSEEETKRQKELRKSRSQYVIEEHDGYFEVKLP